MLPPLESLSLGKRLLLALIIVLATLLMLVIISRLVGDQADAQAQRDVQFYAGIPLDAKLLELDKRALDEAYHAQLLKLWGVWLADGAKRQDYIKTGLAIARRAYGEVVAQIEAREKELKCKRFGPECEQENKP